MHSSFPVIQKAPLIIERFLPVNSKKLSAPVVHLLAHLGTMASTAAAPKRSDDWRVAKKGRLRSADLVQRICGVGKSAQSLTIIG
jgi:hypothetical protein